MHAFENYFSWIILLQVPGIQKKKKNIPCSQGAQSQEENQTDNKNVV